MTTTTTHTIGTGKDYTTLQAWEDASPANLVTSDVVWQGKVANQEFSSASNLLTISGATVDATRYLELTTDTGCSFIDNANVQTNALRYTAANGAAIKLTGAYTGAIVVSQAYTRISKLQIAGTAHKGSAIRSGIGNVDINQCIIEHYTGLGGSTSGLYMDAAGNKLRNSVVISRYTAPTNILFFGYSGSVVNCTLVSTAAASTYGIQGSYGTTTLENVYVGNATTVTNGSTTYNKTTCFTSASGPPTGWSAAAFSTSTGAKFQNITDGTHDFRIQSGSTLADAGTTDTTYGTPDIAGTARPSSTAYDVGAWELVVAGGFTAVNRRSLGARVGSRSAY